MYAALEAGAAGYISKDSSRAEIVEAVADVAAGRTVVPPGLAAGLASEIRLRRTSDAPILSDREREVLSGFARGLSIPQIADELFLGASTVFAVVKLVIIVLPVFVVFGAIGFSPSTTFAPS